MHERHAHITAAAPHSAGSGFTLLELLITLSILAILTTAGSIGYIQYKKSAATTVERTRIQKLASIINLIKTTTGKSMMDITGSSCSGCASGCRNSTPPSSNCASVWQSRLSAIQAEAAAAGITDDLSTFITDTWGNPYLLDEQENERAPACSAVNIPCNTTQNILDCKAAGGSCSSVYGWSGDWAACAADILESVGPNGTWQNSGGDDIRIFLENGKRDAGPGHNIDCTVPVE